MTNTTTHIFPIGYSAIQKVVTTIPLTGLVKKRNL